MAVADSDFVAEFTRNWRVLVVAFCCFVFAFSAPAFLLPFLYPEVIREFGWSREEAVFLASWKYLTGAIVSIVVGRFLDIIGARRVLIAVSVLGGLALLSFLWTPNLGAYYAAGVMLGFAGAGTMVSIKVLVSRTFHASQGTAMGIAMLGTSVGATIVPLVATWVIDAYGWRAGSALLSIGTWLVALPLMVFYLSDDAFENGSGGGETGSTATGVDWIALRSFVADRRFWLILLAVFAVGFVDQAFVQHQVLYLREDLGHGATLVATAISAIGLIGFATRPLVGSLFDGLSHKGVAISYGVLALGCIVALGALNPSLLVVFVMLRAVGHSAVLLDTLVLAKHSFGLSNIGILIGIYTAAVNIGFALGPPVVARLHAETGSYTVPFLLCAGLCIIAALALLPVTPAYWLESRQRGQSTAGPLVSGQ
jgi:MFS family permease